MTNTEESTAAHLCRLVANLPDPVDGSVVGNCTDCNAEIWVLNTAANPPSTAMMPDGQVVTGLPMPSDAIPLCGYCTVKRIIGEGDLDQAMALMAMVEAVEGPRR